MSINLACVNARVLRDKVKVSRLIRDLFSLGVDVVAIQKTHFAILMLVCFLAPSSSIQHTGTSWTTEFPSQLNVAWMQLWALFMPMH